MVARWSIGRAALLVAGLTGVSTVLGFLRDAVIAAVYGAGPQLDAYFVALGLSNILLGLLGTSLVRAATPVVAREAAGEERCLGHRGWSTAITVALVVMGALSIVLGIFAAPVAAVLAPGFEGQASETLVLLTRIVLATTVLVAATDLLAALAQAHGVFRWGALQGVPFNLVMITAAGLFGPRYGILALVAGFVIGSLARLLLQLVPVVRHRWRVRPAWELRDPGFREIVRVLPPLMVGQGVLNVNTLVDRAVASMVGEGAVSAVFLGWRLVNLPEMLVVAALVAPLYPAMAAAADDTARLRRLVLRGLAVSLTLLVPVVVLMAAAPRELVTLAFGRGAFDEEAVRLTGIAVVGFLPGLLALACRQVLVSACYARGDMRGPATVSVIAMVVNVVGDLTLAPVLGVLGIVIATSASLLVAAVGIGWLALRRHGLVDRQLTGVLRRTLVAGTGALGLTWLLLRQLDLGQAWLVVLVGGAAALLLCQLGLALQRAPERHIVAQVVRQLSRR